MGIEWGARAGLLKRLALILIALFAAGSQFASAQTPTPEQMEVFRNLPPDQQQAILNAAGGSNDGTTRRDSQLQSPATTRAPTGANGGDVTNGGLPVGPPRIGPHETVIVDVTVEEQVVTDATEAVRQTINGRRERIANGNPYVLDEQGRLSLPIVPPLVLSGLTDVQAAQLLNADPRLQGLKFSVSLLPVVPVGSDALKPFGYDLFSEVPTTFAPASDIPVPGDYRIGPGDNVSIELFGKKTGRYQLVVDRNGGLTLPEFGPIQVTGLSFDQMRSDIERRVSDQMIGVRAIVTMGQLRSIRIFVVGDVVRPGTYTVSGLSTITNALFASGGVSKIGSLRNIELKRGGQTVVRFDLYDLLIRGDTSHDRQLQQGDVILVPAIGSSASIAGQVQRPAIYEFRAGTTVADLIELSGGMKPTGDPRQIRLERISDSHERVVLSIDLSSPADRNRTLLSGDLLTVPDVLDDTQGVTLEGHVQRTGAYAWHQGMRLSELLGSPQVFKVNADQRYVLIRREVAPDRRIEILSADATRAFQAKGTDADPLLHSRDRVIVFSRQPDRGAALADILKEVRLQARDNSPMPVVSINGRVRAPGEYPLETTMTVGDLIRAGGGFEDAAYPGSAELTRYEVVNGESRKTEVMQLDLAGAGASTPLRAYDVLLVKETPDWREQESIVLRGEVRFPGAYPIRHGETLSSVIERAGGLTEAAFPRGSVFMREELKEQERQQVERLTNRLQSDLALVALQNTQVKNENTADTLAAGQSLLTQLRSVAPTGRLVIDVESALAHRSEDDIELRGGDQLVIPRLKPYVTVIGEVQNATSHVWKSALARNDYVDLSGGTTSRADTKRIYVVRANGSVVTGKGSSWFSRGGNVNLEPGDTIIVPIDAERMRPLPLWTAVTTIVYNLAVAVAAIGSL